MISYDYLQVADYFGRLVSLDWVEDTQSKIESLSNTPPSLLLTATDNQDKDLRHIIKAEATASQLVMGDGKGVILFKKSDYNLSSSNLEITCFNTTNQLNIYLNNNVVNDTLNKNMLITGAVEINLPEYYKNTDKDSYKLRIPLNLFVLKEGIYYGQPSLIKARVFYDFPATGSTSTVEYKDILIYLDIRTVLQNNNRLAIYIQAYEVHLDLRESFVKFKSGGVLTDFQILDNMQGYSFKPIKFSSDTTTPTVTPTVPLAHITVLSLDII